MSQKKEMDDLTKFIKSAKGREIHKLEDLYKESRKINKETPASIPCPPFLSKIIEFLQEKGKWNQEHELALVRIYPKWIIKRWYRKAAHRYREYLSDLALKSSDEELQTFRKIFLEHVKNKPPRKMRTAKPKGPPKPIPTSTKPYGRYSTPRGVKPPVYNERDSFQGRIVPRR